MDSSMDDFPKFIPGASSSSITNTEDDIELANLDDIAITPDPRRHLENGHNKHSPYNQISEDDDNSDEGDDGNVALLGSDGRTRGRERPSMHPPGVWLQVRSIVIESAPTLLLTTIGLLFTGELLDHVSRWRAMTQVDELIMIIPVILNLKGNIEMNLSARLGTAANIGELDKPETRRSMIFGNLFLLQVQATVVSFVAACVSVLLGFVVPKVIQKYTPPTNATDIISPTNTTIATIRHLPPIHFPRRPRPTIPSFDRPKSGFAEFIMVASTAMSAACLSSLVLGSFMCTLIVLCRRFGRDPDNIAPPIASCLGDLITLCLLGIVSTILIYFIRTPIPFVLCILIILSSVSCLMLTYRNPFVKSLLKQGWSPLFGAMAISSCTGIVLDLFVSRYEGFALLAVVISGLPGSVGSIFVSRLSTALHAAAFYSSPQSQHTTQRITADPSPRLAMVTLLLITLPVEIIFLAVLRVLGWLHLPFVFVAFSVIFFCGAVTISLFLAQLLANFLWSKDLDPDMYALPIHSALMDLVGQLLLVLCFEVVSLMGAHLTIKPPG